jgi:hypothetical protein
MAVVCEAECGWLIDHQQAINTQYRDTAQPNGNLTHFKSKQDLFEINEPFMMDSQFEKLQRDKEDPEGDKSATRKRKILKKRKHDLNEGEQAAIDAHQTVSRIISTAYKQLVQLGKEHGWCAKVPSGQSAAEELPQNLPDSETSPDLVKDNNQKARLASQIQGSGDDLRELSQLAALQTNSQPPQSVALHNAGKAPSDLINSYVENTSSSPIVLDLIGHQYLIPVKSSFLLSDITNISTLHQQG